MCKSLIRTGYWLICPLLFAFADSNHSSTPVTGGSSGNRIQEVARKAEVGSQLWVEFHRLFAQTDNDALSAMTTDQNDTLAVQAAWEQVKRTFRPKPAKVDGIVTTREAIKVDSDRLNWFLGFLQGRLRVVCPEWWKRELLRLSYASQRGVIVKGLWDMAHDLNEVFNNTEAAVLPIGTSMSIRDGAIEIAIGPESMKLPNELVRQLDGGPDCITSLAVAMTEQYCFVAFPEVDKYHLWCVNRNGGKVAWSATVLCGKQPINQQGPLSFRAVLSISGDRVIVYGADRYLMYAEGFAIEDGAVRFRFSTTYSDEAKELEDD